MRCMSIPPNLPPLDSPMNYPSFYNLLYNLIFQLNVFKTSEKLFSELKRDRNYAFKTIQILQSSPRLEFILISSTVLAMIFLVSFPFFSDPGVIYRLLRVSWLSTSGVSADLRRGGGCPPPPKKIFPMPPQEVSLSATFT